MSDPIKNHGEGWAVLLPIALVVSNEVRVAMPGLPQLLLDLRLIRTTFQMFARQTW